MDPREQSTNFEFERNPSAESANRILDTLGKRLPKDGGIPLSPPELDEPQPATLPMHEELVGGRLTHLSMVEQPLDSPVHVQRAVFEQDTAALDPDQTWEVFIVGPEDTAQPIVYIWRSRDDPNRISWGISGNDSTGYKLSSEQSGLTSAEALVS